VWGRRYVMQCAPQMSLPSTKPRRISEDNRPTTLSSLWLRTFTCSDDQRSHAAILQFYPCPTPCIESAIAHSATAAGAEAVSEDNHRRAAAASVGVAQLVHEFFAMAISGAG
jgi:hypothetical protein